MVTYESVENGRRKKCHEFKSALHPIMPKLRKCFHPKVSKIVKFYVIYFNLSSQYYI